MHLLVGYRDIRSTRPLEYLSFDLDAGTSARVTGPVGRETPRGPTRAGDDLLFGISKEPGAFGRFDTAANTLTLLDWPAAAGSPYAIDVSPDESLVWVGSANAVRLVSVGVATGAVTDHGSPDPTFGAPEPYVYYVNADQDGRHVYGALGKQDWRLFVYDAVADSYTVHFEGEGDTFGQLTRRSNGHCYYKRTQAAGTQETYRLEAGALTLVADYEGSAELAPGQIDTVYWSGNPREDWGRQFDFSGLEPGPDGLVTVRHRATDADPWEEVTGTVPVGEQSLQFAVPYDEGGATAVLGVPAAYGPSSRHTDAGGIERVGRFPLSCYAALGGTNGRVYLGGYPSVAYEWDPAEPWTLDPYDNSFTDGGTNPKWLRAPGKYCEHLAEAGGLVLMGGLWTRDEYGAEAAVYDSAAGTTATLFKETSATQAATRLGIGGAAMCDDGADVRAVLSVAVADRSQDAKLRVYDAATTAHERTFTPLPGVATAARLVALPGGDVLGLAGGKAFRADPSDGSVAWTTTLEVASDGRTPAYRTADGMCYLWIGSRLHRLDPSDGTVTALGVTTADRGPLATDGDGLFFPSGATLYRIVGSVLDAA